ncbi:MAG: MoxR family ATPase [Candidatus Thermoplasmatota archaeon]|nr:MoxR family ATPase [Candidatus Thermoplasmatota archaeon]
MTPDQTTSSSAAEGQFTTDKSAELARRIGDQAQRLFEEVCKVIVGKHEKIRLIIAALITEGAHVLMEDMPGLGKSVLSNTLAQATGCDFRRIQFTPDLLPADINGTYIYDQKVGEFVFKPGPIFTNFLLADEINRASPKTQSALLEAMAEKQVSVEGTTHNLPKPFVVMATQNPVEQQGTYPLPEAQMDRFMIKMSMGYPDLDEEAEIITRRMSRKSDSFKVQQITTAKTIEQMQRATEEVHVSKDIVRYISKIIVGTREHHHVTAGSSPRGTLALFKLSRAVAAMEQRDYVTPDDVKQLVHHVLAHRLILKPEARIKRIPPEQILDEIVADIPVPKV